ncbi:MAG: LptA/OstA family protein [Armatimonadota bacterium]|nr:LptA/OstA family protein [Armatimonadota bacterium]
MKPSLAWALAAGIAAAAAGAWLVVPAELDRPLRPDAGAGPHRTPGAVLAGAEVVVREAGRLRARIAADRAEWTPDGRTATLSGRPRITIAVEAHGGPRVLQVEAARVTVDPQTQAMRLTGGLRVTAQAAGVLVARAAVWDAQAQVLDLTLAQAEESEVGRLRADRIRYDARARVVHASGHVALVVRGLEIRADRVRYEQETQIGHFEGAVRAIGRGRHLIAAALRYDGRREVAEATGGARLVQGDLVVRASVLRFLLREDVADAAGDVEAVQGALRLSAASLRHDGRTGEVIADGSVSLHRPGTRVSGPRLVADLTSRRAEITGGATLVSAAAGGADGEETTVTARRLVVRWDANEVEAHEEVVVRQRRRTAWADRLDYSEPRDRLVLTGKVVVEQQAGATRLSCARLVATLRTGDLEAVGPVTVVQPDRRATGDRATYAEATRVLVLTGQVRVEEADGRRLRADRVVVSLDDDTLEAEGDVQTEFLIRPGSAGRP